LFIDHVP